MRAGRGKDMEQFFSSEWLVCKKGLSAQKNRCGPHLSGVLSINKEQSRLPEILGLSFLSHTSGVLCVQNPMQQTLDLPGTPGFL